jgi:hypothetical protein
MINIDETKFVIERDPTAMPPVPKPVHSFSSLRSFRTLLPTEIGDLVWTYPRQVALFLRDMGVSFDELEDYIQNGGRNAPAFLSMFADRLDPEDDDLELKTKTMRTLSGTQSRPSPRLSSSQPTRNRPMKLE